MNQKQIQDINTGSNLTSAGTGIATYRKVSESLKISKQLVAYAEKTYIRNAQHNDKMEQLIQEQTKVLQQLTEQLIVLNNYLAKKE